MDSPTPHAGPPISFGRSTPTPDPAPTSPVGDGARGLAVVVLVLSGLITAIDGGVVLASLPELHRVYTGDSSGEALLSLFDGLVVVLGALSVAVWIVTAWWLAAERARLRGPFRHGAAGTFWWWIVPIANLVKPFRVVEEVHRAAVPPSRQGGWARGGGAGWAPAPRPWRPTRRSPPTATATPPCRCSRCSRSPRCCSSRRTASGPRSSGARRGPDRIGSGQPTSRGWLQPSAGTLSRITSEPPTRAPTRPSNGSITVVARLYGAVGLSSAAMPESRIVSSSWVC